MQSVAYLVVLGEQNPSILDEFAHSYESLRRHHPDVAVFVYYDNLSEAQLAWVRSLPEVIEMPIGVDRSGRFAANRYAERYGWKFPELRVLAAKIDVLLLTPGDTLFLDTDTEVRAPLDEVFESAGVWMYESEGLLATHERNLRGVLSQVRWANLGWRGDRNRLQMYNSGAIWLPQASKVNLYRAKELLWTLASLPAEERGDNRLDEQLALSIALQEASDYAVREVAPRVHHFWREKYETRQRWYQPKFAAAAGCP